MSELKHYIAINSTLVGSLARQLDLPIDQEQTSGRQFGLVGKVGVGFNRSTKRSPMPPDDPRLLAPIMTALRENGQLRVYRPGAAREFWAEPNNWYVYETAVAHPFLLPIDKEKLGNDYLPEALTIWIIGSGDEYQGLRSEAHSEDTPWVFLVEELNSFPEAKIRVSGISALRIIKEFVTESPVMNLDDWQGQYAGHGGGDFGPLFHLRAIDDLARFGGIPQRPRRIETVYKIAYMTHQDSVSGQRLGDIFAYPLFIAE